MVVVIVGIEERASFMDAKRRGERRGAKTPGENLGGTGERIPPGPESHRAAPGGGPGGAETPAARDQGQPPAGM